MKISIDKWYGFQLNFGMVFNRYIQRAQDSIETTFNKEATTELLYSVTLPYTYFGIKYHHGKKWGVYLHARANFRVIKELNYTHYTSFLGSFGVSFKVNPYVKPYIGIGAASYSIGWADNPNPSASDGWDTGFYWGGEIGLLLFIFDRDRVVLDVGFCNVIEPSVNLGVGFSF